MVGGARASTLLVPRQRSVESDAPSTMLRMVPLPRVRGGGCNTFPFPRAPAPRVLPINNVILLVTTGLDPVVYADLRQQG
jgi:hypothetical protein